MTDFLPVYNRADDLFALVLDDETLTIPSHEWAYVPRQYAEQLASQETLFLLPTTQPARFLPHWLNPTTRALTVGGPVDGVSGFGLSTALLMEALNAEGVEVSYERTGWAHTTDLSEQVGTLVDPVRKGKYPPLRGGDQRGLMTEIEEDHIVWTRTPELRTLNRWAIGLTIPPELRKVSSPNVLLYSMWECDTLPTRENYLLMGDESKRPPDWRTDPNAWPEWCAARARLIAVPCPDQQRVWEGALNRPVTVVPLGLDTRYTYHERTATRPYLRAKEGWEQGRTEPRDTFTLLVYGELAGNPRKPSLELIQEVIYPVLDQQTNWRLIVKTRGRSRQSLLAAVHDERITVISGDLSQAEMLELCQIADCGIVLSRYEGWGLPFREMMATGLPVIVSDNSGHAEDCDLRYNMPVPCPTQTRAPDVVGNWYEPDWDIARAYLRQEYLAWQARGGTQSPLGREAASWITQRRRWARTSGLLLDLIDQAEH